MRENVKFFENRRKFQMNFLPNSEDFRWIFSKIQRIFYWIFSQNQRILDGFSHKFGEFQMDFLLIQRILDEVSPKSGGFQTIFLPKSEKILVMLSPEIRESCHQKSEGGIPSIPLPLAPPLMLTSQNHFMFGAVDEWLTRSLGGI